jgi:hypothetical protein
MYGQYLPVCCPLCCDGSAVQRVSAVVAAGSGTFAGTGYGAGIGARDARFVSGFATGTTRTHLAAMLARPTPRSSGGCALLLGILFLGISTAAVMGVVEGGDPDAIPAAAIPAVCTILFLAAGIRSARRYNRDLPQLQEAQRRWERLYYCYRDDLVFDPVTGAYSPTGLVGHLLWG